jgi:hypothetical protein
VLRARAAPPPAPPVTPPPEPVGAPPVPPVPASRAPLTSLRKAAIGLGVGAIVLATVGTGVYLSKLSDYRQQREACMGGCSPVSLQALTDDVQRVTAGGATLWALAGAAAVVDVALWIVEARRTPPRSAAAGRSPRPL